jgi:hypothetical protein
MLASGRRSIVFLLLGPALGVGSAALIDLAAGRRVVFEEGAILAFFFAFVVSIVTGPIDGYLARFLRQPLRAPLSAAVGGTTAAFLVVGLLGWSVPSQGLTPIALSGAVCMGLCSLLSGPARDDLLR